MHRQLAVGNCSVSAHMWSEWSRSWVSDGSTPSATVAGNRRMLSCATLQLLILATCAALGATAATEGSRCARPKPKERLSAYGPLNFSRSIRTSSQEAQALFDQGLLLCWNYNQKVRLLRGLMDLTAPGDRARWALITCSPLRFAFTGGDCLIHRCADL